MKKRVALITALFMAVYSLSVFAASFSDMPEEGSEYYAALKYAADKNIVTGDGDKIMPNAHTTRAQAAAMISRAVTLPEAKSFSAADVSKDSWYYEPVSKMVSAGYMALSDDHAYPSRDLSRQEAFIIIQKVFKVSGEADLSAYTDLSKLSSEGREALSALTASGIVKIKGSAIAPDSSVTRADFVLWMYNALTLSSEKASEPTESASEQPSEAVTEAPTQTAESREALEIMRVALGIRADGSSYTSFSSYRDSVQEINYSGSSSSGGSSRPSGGSGGSNKPDKPTEPTEPPTQAPTEPTEAPTWNGSFDNDNDNTVDDPFDDNWKPGSGGNDDEDDDFIIPDDGDDPEEGNTRPTSPTEPTDAPSEDITDPDEPSNAPSEPTVPEDSLPSEDASAPDEAESLPSDAEEPSEESGEPEDEDNSPPDESPASFIAAVFKDWWFI